MMTAGIAATRPIAGASSGSAIPGAPTGGVRGGGFGTPVKLFMMPHTVPNRPTKGEVEPMVASTPMPTRMRRASARMISEKLEAARSLMPVSLDRPADIRASRSAAARKDGRIPALESSAICASASERASAIFFSAERSLVEAIDNSIDLAISTVQVTSDAKASPIITAFTMISADWNITQGDNSFMAGAMPAAVSDFAAADTTAWGAAGGATTGAGLTADG